jgi:ribonuclease BN (tRNA processing enzyme)
LRHPGVTLGYRIAHEAFGPSLAYVTDNELGDGEGDPNASSDQWYQSLVGHLKGVDILVHDAMYSEESKPSRVGWGHSTPAEAVELALDCGSQRLVLFHHDPAHSDDVLDRLVNNAQKKASARGSTLVVEAAREGSTLSL